MAASRCISRATLPLSEGKMVSSQGATMRSTSEHSSGVKPSKSEAQSSFSARDPLLPLIHCPKCDVEIKRYQSNSIANLGRVYYKCPKNSGQYVRCKFYFCEEEYKQYLVDCGMLVLHEDHSDEYLSEDANVDRVKIGEIARVVDGLKEQNCGMRNAFLEIKDELKKQTNIIKLVVFCFALFLALLLGMLAVLVAK